MQHFPSFSTLPRVGPSTPHIGGLALVGVLLTNRAHSEAVVLLSCRGACARNSIGDDAGPVCSRPTYGIRALCQGRWYVLKVDITVVRVL